jgi:hypothetical protein
MKKIVMFFLLAMCLRSSCVAQPTEEVRPKKSVVERACLLAKGVGSLGVGIFGALTWYGYAYDQYDYLVIKPRKAEEMGIGELVKRSVPDILWQVSKTVGLGGALAYTNYKLFFPLAYRNIREALS